MENKEIERIIGEAIGEGSMCWSKIPEGIFDSKNASRIVKETVSKIINMKMNKFKEARKLMHETLLKDKDLYIAYQANIAMLLHDEQDENGGEPINYQNYENRNEIANKLIKLIFS